ncbi:alpha/beta fold hydrolase [Vibrio aquimaris]|uniref:Haloalkane dehalogenase n=1 Tax=Vibrio aquimaris TaxID=2587862 RepID=A0A5P9CKB4_9VIBR|nr:alpha/beta hydrolase [Vibrio aquimaris]QFT26127.1 haloalkane dehalogenase [Vibrio aquimaris]
MRKQVVCATIVSFLAGLSMKSSLASELDTETHYTEEGIAYVELGNPSSDYRLIFIHGSPGSKEGYQNYLSDPWLLDHAQLISVDRIGYGQSPNRLETKISQQSKYLQPLLASDKKNILVGHSLGGPIALSLALQMPELVNGLVFVAPAFDPELETPKWYNILADTWLIGLFLNQNWSMSNGEMMTLADELSLLSAKNWQLLDNMPVTLIHGDQDTIADPNNSKFAMHHLSGKLKKLVQVEGEGHFILWKSPAKIVAEIKHMIEVMPET